MSLISYMFKSLITLTFFEIMYISLLFLKILPAEISPEEVVLNVSTKA